MSTNEPNSYGTDDAAFDEYIDMDFLRSNAMEEDVDIGNMSTSDLFRYYLEGELAKDATNLDSSIYATPMQNNTDDFSLVTSPNSVEEPKMNPLNLAEETNALSQSTNVPTEVGPSLAILNAQLAELLAKLPSFKQESYADNKAPILSSSTLPEKNSSQSNILATLKLSATSSNSKESDLNKLDDNTQIDLKKLSSKERRQLRNKISARNFRVRRKEYIQSLESAKEQQQEEINLLRQALIHLQEENSRLQQEVEELRKQQKSTNKAVINSPPSPPHNSTLSTKETNSSNSVLAFSKNNGNVQRSKAPQPSSPDSRYLIISNVNKDKPPTSSPTNQNTWPDSRVRVQTTLIPEFNLDKHLFEEKSAFSYPNFWNGSMIAQPSLRDVFALDQKALFAYMLMTNVMQRLSALFIEAVCATPQQKMISVLFPKSSITLPDIYPDTLTESLQPLEIADEKDCIPDKISEQTSSNEKQASNESNAEEPLLDNNTM